MNTRAGMTCTFSFFHVSFRALGMVHAKLALYARKPLTKKKSGIRMSTRKGRAALVFSVSWKETCAT